LTPITPREVTPTGPALNGSAQAVAPAPNRPAVEGSPLVVEDVVKRYRQGETEVRALDGVSLAVTRGQLLAVMGASGSGKSTMLHLMAGLTTADAGRVLVDGQDLGTLDDKRLTLFRRRHIGLVFQSFNLIPTLTAEENLLLPLMLDGKASAAAGGPAVAELLRVLGIERRRHHRPDAMSGGGTTAPTP
jgi:putative ABC transport system ATP-binding protein